MNADKPYFVVLNTQNGGAVLAADPEGEVYWFRTIEEANVCGNNTFFGQHFGFEVFCRGEGCSVF
jgi:hypothetical protein